MRITEQTIGIDKQSTAFIGSIDADGFPNMKAMLAPRKHEDVVTIYFQEFIQKRIFTYTIPEYTLSKFQKYIKA